MKYEVIESRHWFQESTGRTASVYGGVYIHDRTEW
jgi:hypothetical protein